ncbi:hypothetical protein CP02DC21_2020, partial [Chlamydia psittaci 02DC21]
MKSQGSTHSGECTLRGVLTQESANSEECTLRGVLIQGS